MRSASLRARLLTLFFASIAGYGAATFPELFVRKGDIPRSADILVVPGGDNGDRTLLAASLHRDSPSAVMLLMGYNDGLLGSGTYRGEWQTAWLTERNVPRRLILYDTAARSTLDEAYATIRLAEKLGARRVVVVTDPTHALRCSFTYGHIFEGANIEVIVVENHPTWRRAEKWWSNRIAASNTLFEIPKIVYYWFRVVLLSSS